MALSREEWEARKAKTLSKEEWAKAKRMKALEQSKANIAADAEGYKASSSGEGQNWELATPFGRVNTGLKKSGGADRVLAGAGSGLASISDRAGNFLGAGGRFSDEALAEKKKLEEDLVSTTGGAGGRLLGQIVATAPIGTALGAVAKGASVLPGASRLASIAARAPMVSMVGRAGGAALEGATSGALMSDPGEAVGAALMGGALSGGMNAAGQVGGKLLRAMRPEVTDAAKRVMNQTGEHIPLPQALPKDSLLRQVYSGVVANLPGQTLRRQTGKAVDAAREKVFSTSLPHGTPVNSVFQSGDDTYTAMKHAKQVWETAFDDTNKAVVRGFDVPQDVADAIRKSKPNAVIPRTGRPITGRQMTEFKKNVNDLAKVEKTNSLNMAQHQRLWNLAKTADKRMYRDLLGQNARDQFGSPLWTQYAHNTRNYNNWLKVQSAAKKAEGGEFTPQQWESLIRRSNVKEGIKDFADDAAKALPKYPSNPGVFQMAAAMGLAGGAGVGAYSAGPDASISERLLAAAKGAGSVYAAGRGLSSKPVQKMLAQYGDEGLLDKYPQLLRAMGGVVRRGAVAEQNDEE